MMALTRETVRAELLRNALPGRLTEQDALLWMVLLHTHAIHLRPGILVGCGDSERAEGITVLPAETRRGTASDIAALWPDRMDERANYVYWSFQYSIRTPHEVLSEVPENLRTRILELRRLLASDPRIAAIVEED